MQLFNKRSLLLLAVVSLTTGLLRAQEFNTNERLRDQLMKGTAPGLRFDRSPKTVTREIKPTAIQQKESLVAQIRKGTAPNMKFQSGGSMARAAAPAVAAKPTAAKQGPLASEMEVPKAGKAQPAAAVIPSQEEQQ